ncbi:MAG: putative Ig domain-containing protein, partial [Tepidisphaeraceae bacterium]
LPNGGASNIFAQPVLAPAFTSPSAATFAPGIPNSFTITTNGSPSPTFTESGALPAGVTFMDNGNGTATLSGTPTNPVVASFPVTITASNGVGSAITQSFTLSIQLPVITRTGTTVTAVGTGANDTDLVSVSNGKVVITLDGMTRSFAMTSVGSVTLDLGDGNDTLSVSAGVPSVSIQGGSGNSSIMAGSADSTIHSGSGNDSIISSGKGSSLKANGGKDDLVADAKVETIHGGSGIDTIDPLKGGDSLKGGAGTNFFLDAGAKNPDTINGGTGFSFAQYNPTDVMSNIFEIIDPPDPVSASPAAITGNTLVGGPLDSSDSVAAAVVDGELQVTGTSGRDVISVTLNSAGTKLKVVGNDVNVGLFSLAGLVAIHINGAAGADSISVGSTVTLPATLLGNGGADTLVGGGGDNVLIGGGGGDSLVGGAGTNLLVPDGNTSFLSGPAGNDTLDGGTGFSIADFSRRTDPLTLSNNGVADSGDTSQHEADEIMANISAIWGGAGGNTITGATGGEFLSGGAGANSVHGGGANDLLVGGGGNDTVIVAAEPVSLYLINGFSNKYGGVNNPSEDILQLDSLDTQIG